MRNIYDLKQEIQDLKNVRDVIATLERISASYIPPVRQHLDVLTGYAANIRRIFRNLNAQQEREDTEEILRPLCIVFSMDHGLVGGLNVRLVESVVSHLQENPKDQVVVFGEKGRELLRSLGYEIAMQYPALSDKPTIDELRDFFWRFFSGNSIAYERMTVIAPQFVSVLEQDCRPVTVWPAQNPEKQNDADEKEAVETYSFLEPSRRRIAEFLIMRMIQLTVYEKALGAKLSEHAARMTAMADAGKSAGKIIGNLEHQYFKARQYTITKRLSEVFSAKQSLKQE